MIITVILLVDPTRQPAIRVLTATGTPAAVVDSRAGASGQHLIVSFKLPDGTYTKARLNVPVTSHNAIQPGDSVRFSTTLRVPERRTPHENDYGRFLRKKGIFYTGFVEPDSISVISPPQGITNRIRSLRPLVGDLLRRSSLSAPTCEFLTATLTGDTSTLTADSRQLFSEAGVSHVLALSGLHVGLLLLVITIALSPLYLLRLGRIRLILSITFLWCYAIFTGMSPSVTRAVIMATAMSGGLILQRRYSGFNALLLAACVTLIAAPEQLYQPGFQLSYISVAAILAVTPLFESFDRCKKIMFYFISLMAVTVSATIATGILSAYYFHTFPVYFLLANIPVLLLLPPLMGCGVLLIIAEAAGYNPVLLCNVADTLYDAVTAIVTFISDMPGATFAHLYFPGWVTVPYFISVAALLLWVYRRKKRYFTLFTGVSAVTVACLSFTKPSHLEEELFLTHDTYSTSAIYCNGDTAYLITNAGARNAVTLAERYSRIYSDYLGSRGIDSLLVAPDTLTCGSLTRLSALTKYRGRSYIIVDRNKWTGMPDSTAPRYAVICRGFQGDVIKVARSLRPDTVLLSNDLHPRRHNRYADSLRVHDIPFRSLKNH